MRNSKAGRRAVTAPVLRIDSGQIHRVPQAFLTGRRFINWRWDMKADGDLNKRPWAPGCGFNINGADLSNAVDPLTALTRMDEVTGVGVMCGDAADAFPLVVIDGDYKGFMARHGPVVELEGGATMPRCVWELVQELRAAGALVELSPSRQGFHAYLCGTLPPTHRIKGIRLSEPWATHLTGGVTPAGLNLISLEVYTTKRWLTLTGDLLNEEDEDNWVPDAHRSQPWLDGFAEAALKRTGAAGAGSDSGDAPDLGDLERGYREPAGADPRLAEAARVPAFLTLWRDEQGALAAGADQSHSTRRWKLLGWLVAALGGDTVAAGRAFAHSALMNDKCLTRRGTTTLLEYELARAAAAWDGRVFPQPRRTPTKADTLKLQVPAWTEGDRDRLLFDVLSGAPGTLAQRKAVRALIADIFDAIDAGKYSVQGGLCVPHLGGLTALSERIGGQRTQIMSRLEWLATARILTRVERDPATGSPVVFLPLTGAGCPALQAGLPADCPAMPARKASAKRASPTQQQAARPPRTRAEPTRPLNTARWTMHLLLSGVQGAEGISARSRESVRAVKRHLRVLEARGLVQEGLPTVTRQAYAEARQAELAAVQRRTRERRARDTLAWRQTRREGPPLPRDQAA